MRALNVKLGSLQARNLRYAGVFALAAVIGAAAGSISNLTAVSIFGLGTVVLVATILAVRLVYHRTGDALSLLSFLGAYYALGYVAGALYLLFAGDPDPRTAVTPTDVLVALVVATVAWCGLLVGYLGSPLRHVRLVVTTTNPVTVTFPFIVRLGVVLLAGWGARVIEVASGTYFHTVTAGGEVVSTGSSWWIATAATLPTLCMALIGAHAFFQRSRLAKATFLILLGIEIAWHVPSGSRAALVGIATSALVIAYYGGQRIPRKTLAVSIIIFVLFVFPFYLLYRGNSDVYQSRPGAALTEALDTALSDGPIVLALDGLEATFTRFADIKTGAVAVRDGKEVFTRPPGETLSWTLYSVVPRALAPDKPDPGLFGNEFGRSFGIIAPYDYVTSITFGQPYEFFLNFGLIGTILGMPILGAVYRLINDVTRNRRSNAAVLALYATSVLSVTMSLGVIVAHGLAGSLKALALYWLVLFFIGSGLRFTNQVTKHADERPVTGAAHERKQAYA